MRLFYGLWVRCYGLFNFESFCLKLDELKFCFISADDEFMKASQILMTWLERGDLTKRNVTNFYSMIQCTNSQVRRLLSEKQNQEEALQKMKENFRNIFEGILHQCKHFIFSVKKDQTLSERNFAYGNGKSRIKFTPYEKMKYVWYVYDISKIR